MSNTNTLQNWDGYSKQGQAAYDRHFQFEMDHSAIMDIIENQLEYSEEEVDAAYKALEKYK